MRRCTENLSQRDARFFALSAATGIVAAVLLSSSRWVQQAFYPYAVFFQTVPVIAIAPPAGDLVRLWNANRDRFRILCRVHFSGDRQYAHRNPFY